MLAGEDNFDSDVEVDKQDGLIDEGKARKREAKLAAKREQQSIFSKNSQVMVNTKVGKLVSNMIWFT